MDGNGSKELFENERGGHRHQRVSPTERHGRVHTSTITVAVLDLEPDNGFRLDENDVEFVATTGQGPGGQNRNRVKNCIVATHKPSGLVVRIDSRSQWQNKQIAMQILSAQLTEMDTAKKLGEQNKERKEQIGMGESGSKIRTYREKDDIVIDHRLGKKMSLQKWVKGNWNI